MHSTYNNLLAFIIFCSMVSLGWFIPTPEGLSLQAWHCLIIFITTIIGIIANPLPISVIALIGSMCMVVTQTLTIADILSEFGSQIVCIVVFAFFIAKAFIKTGLGRRIAYIFISKIGHSVLGLSYGLLFTECLLAPLIPSIAARSGGIIYPIAESVIAEYAKNAKATDQELQSTGAYLMNVCHHASTISSAMFLTAMAGNPLVLKLASTLGISINWSNWALGALLPGVVCLLCLPLVLYFISKPGIRFSPDGPALACLELKKMGKMHSSECVMMLVFIALILSWMCEPLTGIDPTTTAILGILILIITGVLKWDDAISDKQAWDTMIWFSLLLALSSHLGHLGVMSWISNGITNLIEPSLTPYMIAAVLFIIYFYIHYFFASLTSHITVFYPIFLKLLLHYALPALPSALLLGYLSNLYGGLTHYGTSAAPIFFGAGYQTIQQWWRVGVIISTINLILWLSISSFWLPLVGLA